jgi:hypothetical protein
MILALAAPVWAQVTVSPIVQPHVTFVDASGSPCASCELYSYVAGTTTPLATYTDASGTSQNTNPIILSAAGGANIWVGQNSYKFILKDAFGVEIWSVDQVKGGGGSGGICGPGGAIQIANSAVNSLTCDATITINTTNHTINVGTLPVNHVTIGALGTPTSWTFDTTSPATALASMGALGDGAGTTTPNQLALSTSSSHVITYSTAIPNGTTATTQSPGDNSTKPATTAYVASPGAINPTSVQIDSGTSMTDNQGNGIKVQHSTGTTTTDNCAKFDANGNVVDSGASCTTGTPRTCNANGCYRIDGDGTIEQWATGVSSFTSRGTTFITWPIPFPNACSNVQATVQFNSTLTGTNWQGAAFYVQPGDCKTSVSLYVDTRSDGSVDGPFHAMVYGIGW